MLKSLKGKTGPAGPAGSTGPAGPASGFAGGALSGSYPNPGINDSVVQSRVTGTCATAGTAINSVNADGSVGCDPGTVLYYKQQGAQQGLAYGSETTIIQFTAPAANSAYLITATGGIGLTPSSSNDTLDASCTLVAANGAHYSISDVGYAEAEFATSGLSGQFPSSLQVVVPASDDPSANPPTISLECEDSYNTNGASDTSRTQNDQVIATPIANAVGQ